MKPIPHTRFSTRLSGSARETEGRLRSLLRGGKKRPPAALLVLLALLIALCGSLVACRETQPRPQIFPDLADYERFLFSPEADVAALLEEATSAEHLVRTTPIEQEWDVLYEYDGAALAPYLPNCLEMQGVTVFGEGGSIVVSYLPSEPEDCTGVALSCMDGQVVAVTAGWGEFGAGYADLLTGEVTVEKW